MPKSTTFATGCMAAAAALTLMTADLSAQERRTPGSGPQGPGAMAPGAGPGGAPTVIGRGRHAQGSWRQLRRAHRMARRIEILDTDKDGKVTLAEIQGEQRRLFGAADVNARQPEYAARLEVARLRCEEHDPSFGRDGGNRRRGIPLAPI